MRLAGLILSRRAVVFDCDGTLVSQAIDYKAVRETVAELLRRHGVPGALLSPSDGVMVMLRRSVEYLSARGVPVDPVVSEVDRVVEAFELEAASKTNLIPGAVELLAFLKERGFKLGLFTLNKRPAMMLVARRFNLDRFMDAMVSRDDAPAPKPDPRHLAAVLSKLSVEARETVVVGDHPVDVECAVKAGAAAIGVLSSGRSRRELEEAGAWTVVDSVASILEDLKAASGPSRE